MIVIKRRANEQASEMYLQAETKSERTGACYEQGWKQCAVTLSAQPIEDTGQHINFEVLNCLQSLSCMDPIHKGKPNENFKEFVRRFLRKYQRAMLGDRTLVEIFGDDQLGGRAKNVFLSLPAKVKNRGFEVVISEMGRLMSEDSVAGRIRAIANSET